MDKKLRLRAVLALILLIIAAVTAVLTAGERYTPAVSLITTPTLVIDAGHGGVDGGAVSDAGTVESGLNLDIALRLRDLMLFMGVAPVMTRTEDTLVSSPEDDTIRKMKVADQKYRVALIDSLTDPVLMSIHMNKYPESSNVSGVQVFYDSDGASRAFAQSLQQMLIESLKPAKKREAAAIGEDIYLTKMTDCPAVLIECGFLSNPGDEANLNDPDYRKLIAVTLAAGWLSSDFVT